MAESVEKEVKLVARHSAVYGIARILERFVGFLMIPVYTRFLTPTDYGVLELIYMTTGIISLVIGLRIEAATSRFYFDYDSPKNRHRVISTGLVGYGGIALLLVAALMPFSGLMARAILDSASYRSFFVVALAALGLDMVVPVGYAFMRVRRKSFTLMVFQLSKTLVSLGLNIYFVVFALQGVFGILLASLIANAAFALIMVGYIAVRAGLRCDGRLLWEMIRFGLPLIPSGFAAYVVHASDRFFVKEYVSMQSAGLYSLGYKIGALVNQFVTSPFTQVWTPRRFELFHKEGSDVLYARIFTYFVTFSLLVGLQIALLSKELIQIMTPELYWPAYRVVPLIVLAYIIFSFHHHFNIGILMKKATRFLAYINIANAALNIVLNIVLIQRYSVWGAAVATLVCFSFKNVLTFYFSNRFYPIRVEWRRVIILFGIAGLVYAAGSQVGTDNLLLDGALKSAVGLLYLPALLATNFFDKEERKKLQQLIRIRKVTFDNVA